MVVWQIGDPARGPLQFSHTWYLSDDRREPVFEVGRSDPAEDWPMYQPGPLNANGGWRGTSATVRFDLRGDIAPAYALVLDVCASHGPAPDLEVELNGRRGLVVLQPQRIDRSRISAPSPVAGWCLETVVVPGEWLHAENNEIRLTTGGATAEPDERRPGHPFFRMWWHYGSTLQWGSLRFEALAAAPAAEPVLDVRPTPLYVDRRGELRELVEMVVTAPLGLKDATVSLDVAGELVEQPVELDGRDFGQWRCLLEVPALDAPAPATARVVADGVEAVHEVVLEPCRRWTLHLIPHVHLDVGYTDHQGKVFELHSRNLDRALAIREHAPDYRLAIDGSMVVEEYLATRSPGARERVLDALRDGTLSVNAWYALFLSGISSLEECYRAAYVAEALEREHGVPALAYANLTDVPSYSSALPSVLAASGIPAFLGIGNHGRAATEDSDELHLLSPFRWAGPDGAEVVAFFADCYSQLRFLAGDPPTVAGCADALSRFVQRYERPDYTPTDLPVVGLNSDNEDLAAGEADLVDRWSRTYAYPRLVWSTPADYFAAVVPHADRLPVVSGDGGSYWEDGVGTDARTVATHRRTQALLPVAEALGALTATVDPTLAPAREALDAAWRDVVIGSEHTWTSLHATSLPDCEQTVDQLEWKRHRVAAGARVAIDETRRGLSQLGELVATDGSMLLVANTCSWARTEFVEVELLVGSELVSPDGDAVPLEVVREWSFMRRVRFLARDVPAFGYVAYRVQPSAQPVTPTAAAIASVADVVETARWTLRHDAGRVTSLRHLPTGREVLDPAAPWSFAEVLHVDAGPTTAGTTLHDWDRLLAPPQLDITAARMTVSEVVRTAAGARVVFTGAGRTLPLVRVAVDLRDDDADGRVDVTVLLHKEKELRKESVYVAFPFAIPGSPRVRYDRQQGWVDPVRDHQPGACGEWFTAQHGVVVDDGAGTGVTWCPAEAPLWVMGDVVRGRWPRQATASPTLLSWVMNNHWWTNFATWQAGEIELHYTIAPTAEVAPAARLGRTLRTPLVASEVTSLDKTLHPGTGLPVRHQLLDVDTTASVTVAVHGARDGRGVIARVQEHAGAQDARAVIRLPGAFTSAALCTALERDIEPMDVTRGVAEVPVGAYGVVSVRLS